MDFRCLRSLSDGSGGLRWIASKELNLTIYDHLRGVGIVELEARGVEVLTFREQGIGEAVAPSGTVPVVNVFFKNNDMSVGYRLLLLEAGEKFVGGRATGAAFRGKELHKNRRTALGRR